MAAGHRGLDALEVRRADTGDAQSLARLGGRLFEQTFADDNSPDDMRSYVSVAFSLERQRDELADPDRVTWLASIGREPVGYATVRRGAAGNGVVASMPVELHRIYVDRSRHGLGVGRRLMDVCVAQARTWAADVLWLGVWERNGRAIAFYEQGGFRAVGRHAFLLGSDEQRDIVMACQLD
jgi:diamine N-acetyltransferase